MCSLLTRYGGKNVRRGNVICMNFRVPQSEKQSHMLDLLDVNLGEASGSSVQTDPWGVPITAPPPKPQVLDNCINNN